MKVAIIHASYYEKASYNDDWLDALLNYDSSFSSYNLEKLNMVEYLKIISNYDYIIFLHTTNSNGFRFNRLLQNGGLRFRKGKIVFFVGNEYKLMKEKIDFISKNKIEYVISQLDVNAASWLYKNTNSKIISLPHALNLSSFSKTINHKDRKIDFGLRAGAYPSYLGHNDREIIFSAIDQLPTNLIIDSSDDENARFRREDWNLFLNNCKFTLACEGGSNFLERNDATRLKINAYVNKHPSVTNEEIYDLFYLNYLGESISARTITARVFDAIGTFTCQILIEGKYNQIINPGEHYIELKRDFSNFSEVLEKISDTKLVEGLCENAYAIVSENHTYEHRVKQLFYELD